MSQGYGNNRDGEVARVAMQRICHYGHIPKHEAKMWTWLWERGFLALRPRSPLLRIHLDIQNSILSANMSHNLDLEAQAEQQVLAVLEEGVERSKIYGGSTSIPLSETKSASGAKPVSTDQQIEVKASPATSQTEGVAFISPYRRIIANPLRNRRRGKPNS